MAARRYAARVRRLKLSAVAWGVWMILSTTLWVADEWDVNGAFERLGHEGDPGQWNPTLWALGIGVPTLIVGIMALGVYFVRRLHMLLPTQQRPVRVLGDHEQARRDPQRARSGVESPFRLVQERGGSADHAHCSARTATTHSRHLDLDELVPQVGWAARRAPALRWEKPRVVPESAHRGDGIGKAEIVKPHESGSGRSPHPAPEPMALRTLSRDSTAAVGCCTNACPDSGGSAAGAAGPSSSGPPPVARGT